MSSPIIASPTIPLHWGSVATDSPSATNGPLLLSQFNQTLREPRFDLIFLSNASSSEVLSVPEADLVKPTPSVEAAAPEGEDAFLAGLPPLARWRFLAKHNKLEFAFNFAAACISIATLVWSLSHLMPSILSALSWAALAQDNSAHGASADATIQYILVAVIAIIVVWCLCMLTFSQQAKTFAFAKDIMKTLVGFLVGFFGGRASR
jgi:hypothetical protein